MDYIRINVPKEYEGKTIKEFLKLNHIGRGKVESIRVNKSSFINDQYCNLETKLKENDKLSFLIDEEIDFICDDKDIEVVYEDEYLLIVNKPANIIIHPDDKSKGGTLVNLVANYYKKNNISRKVRFLHRIDKETTGLVMFAKDFLSEAILLQDIEKHIVQRKYLAFIEGKFSKKQGTIKANIKEDRHINGKMCVYKDGKEAITNYKVIKEYGEYSLVEFVLQTGRTHQIRVHASYLNNPLLGDVLYGGNCLYINRVALHSYEVTFTHPISKQLLTITKELPIDMEQLKK